MIYCSNLHSNSIKVAQDVEASVWNWRVGAETPQQRASKEDKQFFTSHPLCGYQDSSHLGYTGIVDRHCPSDSQQVCSIEVNSEVSENFHILKSGQHVYITGANFLLVFGGNSYQLQN